MKTFAIRFIGRQRGALGTTSEHTVTVEAPTYADAVVKLYDDYEHISVQTAPPAGDIDRATWTRAGTITPRRP